LVASRLLSPSRTPRIPPGDHSADQQHALRRTVDEEHSVAGAYRGQNRLAKITNMGVLSAAFPRRPFCSNSLFVGSSIAAVQGDQDRQT
jgi:hypothetical protein